jgi:hypothetical protein
MQGSRGVSVGGRCRWRRSGRRSSSAAMAGPQWKSRRGSVVGQPCRPRRRRSSGCFEVPGTGSRCLRAAIAGGGGGGCRSPSRNYGHRTASRAGSDGLAWRPTLPGVGIEGKLDNRVPKFSPPSFFLFVVVIIRGSTGFTTFYARIIF